MLILRFANSLNKGWDREVGQAVYALLHSLDGDALDFSAGTATLLPFDGDNDRFGLQLTEDTDRTNFFMAQLTSGSSYVLPDSAYGEPYSVEYWATLSLSGVRSRADDFLLEVVEFPWKSGYNENPVLIDIVNRTNLIPSEPAGSRYEAFVSFSYDSSNLRIGYMCWLEKDGELVTDAISCTLTMVDSSGVEVFTDAVPAAVGADAIDGFFVGEQLTQELFADDNYSVTVEIIDGDSVAHKSASSPVTWD